MEIKIPGTLFRQKLLNPKYPDSEYDDKGIPLGIVPDPANPYLDSCGNDRYVIVYRPSTIRPMIITHALFVVSDVNDEKSAADFLVESDLVSIAEKEKAFIIFAIPAGGGWNSLLAAERPDDIDYIHNVLTAGKIWYLFDGRENAHEYLIGLLGAGSGADMVQLAVAAHPEHANSMIVFGGTLSDTDLIKAGQGAEVCTWLVNPTSGSESFWKNVNGLEDVSPVTVGTTSLFSKNDITAKEVRVTKKALCGPVDSGLVFRFWEEAYSENVRILNRGPGNVFSRRNIFAIDKPSIHINDRSLGDNRGIPHTWYEFVPDCVKAHWDEAGYKCPLVIEMHGGGSVPTMSAAKVQFQEFGKEYGFITVYANASNNNSWNSILRTDRPSDIDYISALTEYLIDRYPIDRSRIYISGFSNGSGMAHLMSAARPDLYAGLIAFNTRYPVKENIYDLIRQVKEKFDYRVPVFSTYGTRDAEFPMKSGCGQFTQMEFWRWYNNILPRTIDVNDPSGIGAPGDRIVHWGAYGDSGEEIFTTHSFCSMDPSAINLYNYTLVSGLPHTVERRLISCALDYIFQFSRNSDGSLQYSRNDSCII